MATPTWIQTRHTLLTKSVNTNQGAEDETHGYRIGLKSAGAKHLLFFY